MEYGSSQFGYLTGKVLIASPVIGDPRFDRSIVYVCSHDSEQAMGLIMNSPIEGILLRDVLCQLDIPRAENHAPQSPVLDGGPVGRDRGFVLHSRDVSFGPASMIVSPDHAVTATREILECLTSEDCPSAYAFTLGYSGWEAGQLEDEINANAWLVCDADDELLFGENHSDKWTRALSQLGVTPEFLSGASGHA